MRKRQKMSDPNSCLNRAAEDELTFVLLGRDPAAVVAIRAWIEARVLLGKNAADDPQIVEAQEWIEAADRERREKEGGGRGVR
jgi:hypothetical protein